MTVTMPVDSTTSHVTAEQLSDPTEPRLLHGTDPDTGRPATWQITSLHGSASEEYRVERAEGVIMHPAVWMQATRTSRSVTAAEADALVRAITEA